MSPSVRPEGEYRSADSSAAAPAAPPRRRWPLRTLAAAGAVAAWLLAAFGLPLSSPASTRSAPPSAAQPLPAPAGDAGSTLRLTLDASSVPAGARRSAARDARRRAADDADVAAVGLPPAATAATAAANAGAADESGARGVVRAVREATLSSRLPARIADMPVPEGASFRAGELLVVFDCERQSAEARAAAAAVEVQRKTVETNVELDKFESIGKNDLSISQSQLDKTRAEADALKSQMKDCKLFAPFAGRVIERMAHSHEAVTANQPLLKVVDTSALELELIVPSSWLQWLAEGAGFAFHIDETGQTLAATVARLTPTVDPVSKTTKVIARFRPGKATSRVLPGMSGTARFSARAAG